MKFSLCLIYDFILGLWESEDALSNLFGKTMHKILGKSLKFLS